MRILILNFRDFKNPAAGGAEKVLYELATRLVKSKNQVFWFCPSFEGGQRKERVDGIEIIRMGNKYTVYILAVIYYFFRFAFRIDFIVDSINTIPFFTPIFVLEPKASFVYQLSGNFLEKTKFSQTSDFYNTSFPFFLLSYYLIEPLTMLLYKNTPSITISNSTEADLKKFKFKKIFKLTLGADKKNKTFRKEKNPTAIYIGRMVGYKKPQDAIEAFLIVKKTVPDARLWMVGGGPLLASLKKKKIRGVEYFGYVSEQKKEELLAKAHIMFFPSIREGWGLTIIEAASLGTLTIGYNVHGIRDAIVDRKTGFLCNGPEEMGALAIQLFENRKLYEKISTSARRYSSKFDWNKTFKEFESAIEKIRSLR